MWTLFLLSGLLTASPQQSSSPAALVPQLQEMQARAVMSRADGLEITLASTVQLPNGRRVGVSVRPAAGPEPWFVYSRGNLCQSVITHSPAPADAAEGWKVTIVERARVTSQGATAPSQVTIGVTWSRMWERGRQILNGSGGTSELTLKRGDQIPLDMITRASDPAACPGTTKNLELQVGANVNTAAVPTGESPLDGVVDAELWMVHTAPNGVETVEHQVVRLMNGVIGFSFRGGPLDTADGQVAIELSGQLKAVRLEDGSRGLWAALTKGVMRLSTGAGTIASPAPTTVGWPTTGDVVQMDLGPLQFYAGRGGGGGGGRGGAVGSTRSGSTATPPTTSQSGSGGATGGIVARSGGAGGGGALSAGGRGTTLPPNLLEGHKLSLRVRLSETPR